MLYHMISISSLSTKSPSDTDKMVQDARDYNRKVYVTGALWFDGTTFVQILEGGRAAISGALARILQSESHVDFELVAFEPAPERLFSEWSMAYFHGSDHEQDIVAKFSVDDKFRPREMSAQSLIAFMRYLEMERHVSAAQAIR